MHRPQHPKFACTYSQDFHFRSSLVPGGGVPNKCYLNELPRCAPFLRYCSKVHAASGRARGKLIRVSQNKNFLVRPVYDTVHINVSSPSEKYCLRKRSLPMPYVNEYDWSRRFYVLLSVSRPLYLYLKPICHRTCLYTTPRPFLSNSAEMSFRKGHFPYCTLQTALLYCGGVGRIVAGVQGKNNFAEVGRVDNFVAQGRCYKSKI